MRLLLLTLFGRDQEHALLPREGAQAIHLQTGERQGKTPVDGI